jgi:hypothetical protein
LDFARRAEVRASFLLAMAGLKRGTTEPNGRKAKSRPQGVNGRASRAVSTQAIGAWPPDPRTSPIAAVKSFNPVPGTMIVFRRP